MVKLIYGAMLMLLSSEAFLFSKEKDDLPCKQSLVGVVKEMKTDEAIYLCIETPDHNIVFPSIENERVVLAAGAKVRVCYDSAGTFKEHSRIRINHVSYLP